MTTISTEDPDLDFIFIDTIVNLKVKSQKTKHEPKLYFSTFNPKLKGPDQLPI